MKPVLVLFFLLKLICVGSNAGEAEALPTPTIAPSPLGRVFDKDHHGHDHAHNHAHTSHDHANHIHFDHPILTEVPTPHNVVSFGYSHTRSSEKTHTDSFELGFEYAPVKWFSFEIATPVEAVNPDEGRFTSGLGSTEFAFKFASFHFEEKGIVLAAGMEFALPTGNDDKDIGSNNEVEIEPFVSLGWKHDKLELVSIFSYGMPVKRDAGDPFAPAFGFQLSTLYHFHSRIAALCELRGETELRGEDRGRTVIEIAPGIKFKPWDSPALEFGVNVILPISDARELDWSAGFALFYHF